MNFIPYEFLHLKLTFQSFVFHLTVLCEWLMEVELARIFFWQGGLFNELYGEID